VRDIEGTLWLFYHTLKKDQWHIWYKTYRDDQGWAPSQPLTNRQLVDRHPTAVVQGTTPWVFWSTYDDARRTWQIAYRTRTDGQWSAIEPLLFADSGAARRQPWAVVDQSGGLWLFWLERLRGHWQLKYNRHDGTAWVLAASSDFPVEAGKDPRVDSPPFILFHPADPTQPLWVFWARKEPTGVPNQARWRIVYRVKASLDPTAADWSVFRSLPTVTPDSHDREPAALVDVDGNIELFWSSNREGSWSIWHGTLNPSTHNWGTVDPIASSPYSHRDPLPVVIEPGISLVYRANESLRYRSTVYGALDTVDARFAGCTTVDTRNQAKMALRGRFEDFQTYTYDVGRSGQRTALDWYARDTVGMYLPAGTAEPAGTSRSQQPFADVLGQFLPIQVRAVFIVEPTPSPTA
jgi:hypothetical protein